MSKTRLVLRDHRLDDDDDDSDDDDGRHTVV